MNVNKYLLFILLLECAHSPLGKNESNRHMHKKSHHDLIKAFDDPSRDDWQKPQFVLKLMGNLRSKKIIDIGAGSGYFSKFFLAQGASVVAADVDETFLSHIKKSLPEALTRLIPFDDPLMEQGTYDYAFTCNTYHHIDDRLSYLKKILAGLKSGGKFVIVDFKAIAEVAGPPLKMRVPFSQVSSELTEAGFSAIEVFNDDLERQYVIIGTKK